MEREWLPDTTGIAQKGKSPLLSAAECVMNIVVPDFVKKPARGWPKKPLYQRRLREFAPILHEYCEIPLSELAACEKTVNEAKPGDSADQTWQERIPSHVLFGGVEEDKQSLLVNYLMKRKPFGAIPRLRYESDVQMLLCEHIERTPLAYGVKGQYGTMLRFTRKPIVSGTDVESEPFYPVRLPEDEPSPVMFDPSTQTDHCYYYSNGFGLCPVLSPSEQDESSGYTDYVVMNGCIHPVEATYSFGQLEPHRVAPTTEEALAMHSQLASKSYISPGELAYLRSSCAYATRAKGIKQLFDISPVVILEAYNILARLLLWGRELDQTLSNASCGVPLNRTDRKELTALRYVVREVQLSPWYWTTCYRYLFREYGNPGTPFPIGVYMRVMGFGSEDGLRASYLPGAELAPDDVISCVPCPWECGWEELAIQTFNTPNPKQKRNPLNVREREKIGGNPDTDTRVLFVSQLNELILQSRIPYHVLHDKIKDRWDKSAIVRMVASSSRGVELLGKELASRYSRQELQVVTHTSDHNKLEMAKVKKIVEEKAFFVKFRALVRCMWHNLIELATPPKPIACRRELSEEETKECDDMAAMLGDELMQNIEQKQSPRVESTKQNAQEEKKEEDDAAKLQEWAAKHEERTTLIDMKQKWAKEVKRLGDELQSPSCAVIRRLVLTYEDRGSYCIDNQRIYAKYMCQKHLRKPQHFLVPEEMEEEIIIEEEYVEE